MPPVAVTVAEPLEADDEAATVRVVVAAALGLAVSVLGERLQVTPAVPEHEKFTWPLNDCTEVSVIVSVTEEPAATVSMLFPDEIWKSGATIETLMTTESVLLPLEP